jgi:hypothetical protein
MVIERSGLKACLRTGTASRWALQLASEHGIQVSPEALWRHRGTLIIGWLPTWRGRTSHGAIIPIRGDRFVALSGAAAKNMG